MKLSMNTHAAVILMHDGIMVIKRESMVDWCEWYTYVGESIDSQGVSFFFFSLSQWEIDLWVQREIAGIANI